MSGNCPKTLRIGEKHCGKCARSLRDSAESEIDHILLGAPDGRNYAGSARNYARIPMGGIFGKYAELYGDRIGRGKLRSAGLA